MSQIMSESAANKDPSDHSKLSMIESKLTVSKDSVSKSGLSAKEQIDKLNDQVNEIQLTQEGQ